MYYTQSETENKQAFMSNQCYQVEDLLKKHPTKLTYMNEIMRSSFVEHEPDNMRYIQPSREDEDKHMLISPRSYDPIPFKR